MCLRNTGGCEVLKLTFNLCVILFVSMAIWGEKLPQSETAEKPSEASILDLARDDKIKPIQRIAFTADYVPPPAYVPELWRVTASRVNVRATPSAKAEILGKVDLGEEVILAGDNGMGWVKIRIEGDGVEGWVSLNMLEKVE